MQQIRSARHLAHQARRSAVPVAALLAAMLLTACGGGGGDPGRTGPTGATTTTGTDGTTTSTSTSRLATVSLSFAGASGAASNSLTSSTPLTVQATVLDASKKPVPNAIVTFGTDTSLAVFTPGNGTALTNDKGVATISMKAASLDAAGAGTVTAATKVAGSTVSGTGNYAVGATSVGFSTLRAEPSALQAYGSTLLSVDLLSGSAKYTEQPVTVNFTSACVTAGKATIGATATTNSGTAQTVYRDQGCGQNDVITASATGVSKSVSTSLQIAPPSAASVQFVKAEPLNQSIVIRGEGGNGRTETATLTFKVVDTLGNPVAGKEVRFTTASTNVTVNSDKGITAADGTVVTTVNSGAVPTSFRVQATLPGLTTPAGQPISTMSDSIVVTTGKPVQSAFSLGVETFNVEGWHLNSSPTKPATTVSIMVADANGNPVADGTPIVFQTNMGSIGSSSKGGCNTVNGGCTVDFRTQDPRTPSVNKPVTPCNSGILARADSVRPGVATICASTSDGLNTVFARAYITFSDSSPAYVYVDGAGLNLSDADLGKLPTKEATTFSLQVEDINHNPMPKGTTISLGSPQGVNLVAPTSVTVGNIAPDPDLPDSNQGSSHSFTIAAPNPNAACSEQKASFKLNVKVPSGLDTTIPFKLTFTCP